jgi:hypothetical protein
MKITIVSMVSLFHHGLPPQSERKIYPNQQKPTFSQIGFFINSNQKSDLLYFIQLHLPT